MNKHIIRDSDFHGELYLPDEPASIGLVIVPGSAGVHDVRERAYASFFASQGLACIIADAFSYQQVPECLTDQTKLSNELLLSFAYRACSYLTTKHIGILGVSKGGFCALNAALELAWLSQIPLAFHISLVPPVHIQLRTPKAFGGPIFLLVAENDDFTPADQALSYLERIKANNPNLLTKSLVVPKASHAWESKGRIQWLPYAERYDHCLFYLEDDGQITVAQTNQTMTRAQFYSVLRTYARLGAHYGGGSAQLFKSICQEILSFIKAVCIQ